MTTEVERTLVPVTIATRQLQGYVGFANLPKQWHRKSIRRGFNLNIMVVGESGLGKATLINTLFNREILAPETVDLEIETPSEAVEQPVTIKSTSAAIEEDGVKLDLTVVSAPGFGENINNADSWKPIVDDIVQRFDSYLEAESRINRASITDERIHALLYFIEPTGHSLSALDIETMKQVHDKVNLIPVIAKSDTLTHDEIRLFKQRVLEDIKYQEIKVFFPLSDAADDEEQAQNTQLMVSKFPLAVIGSTREIEIAGGRTARGRRYPWGVIEVENPDHNDFVVLRQLLVRDFMEELKEFTATTLYELYRLGKLERMGIVQDDTVFREFDPLAKQEEERTIHEAKLSKMEQEMKQVFQQKVLEKEKKLQRLEADLFSRHKEMKEKLQKQIKALEDKKAVLEKQRLTHSDPPPIAPTPQKSRKGFLR